MMQIGFNAVNFPELKFLQDNNPEIIYWEVSYPWPLANRDVSFGINIF